MKYGENTDKGMQFTNANNVTNQQIQNQQFAQLMSQLLSEDPSSGKFDSKGVTVDAGKDSALYKNFLGENDWFKTDQSLLLGDKATQTTYPRSSRIMTTPNQAEVERSRKSMDSNKLLKSSFNAANPFFGSM